MLPPRLPRILFAFCCGALCNCLAWLSATAAVAQVYATDLPPPPAEPRTVTLTLTWPQAVHAEFSVRGRELVIRADQPLDFASFAAVAPQIRRWIVAANVGYDSMVWTLADEVEAQPAVREGIVVIRLNLPGEAPPPEPPPADAARFRLKYLKATLLWSVGELPQAAELLETLAAEQPGNREIRAAQSVVETRLGRWRRASEFYAMASGDPAARERPVQGSEQAARIAVEGVYDYASNGDQQGIRATGYGHLANGWRLGSSAFWLYARQSGDNWSTKYHPWLGGNLDARIDARAGHWLAVGPGFSLMGPSGRSEVGFWSATGATRLIAVYREAAAETPALSGLAFLRSTLGVVRAVRNVVPLARAIAGDVTGSVGARIDWWHSVLSGRFYPDGGEATTLSMTAQLQYVSWRTRPRLTVQYNLSHLQSGLAAQSGPVPPMLATAHVEGLTFGLQQPLFSWLAAEAYAGGGINFFGPNTVQLGASLNWTPQTGPRASLRYSFGASAATLGQYLQSTVASVAWVF